MSDTAQNDEAERDSTALLAELHDLTCNLRSALERFRFESRLNDLAEKEIPDARQRLNHVLKLTDERGASHAGPRGAVLPARRAHRARGGRPYRLVDTLPRAQYFA